MSKQLKKLASFLFLSLILIPVHAAEEKAITFESLLETFVNLDKAFLAPDFQARMYSSYDRKGGNRDESGYIHKDNDWYVIAEMEGPGAVMRIWSANPSGKIRIHLDDGSEPVLERTFRDLFTNRFKPFIKPFVFSGSSRLAAHWAYIPIPYQQSCRITISELCHYQIEYITYPKETPVKTFQYPINDIQADRLSQVAKGFQTTDKPPFFPNKDLVEKTFKITVPAGETIDLATLKGPAVIKGLRMRWPDGSDQIGRDLVLRGYWEKSGEPCIQSPVSDFFGERMRSMTTGEEKTGWHYCYYPMPFHEEGRFTLANNHLSKNYEVQAVFYVQQRANLPVPLRRFHALWNRDNDTALPEVKFNDIRFEPVNDLNDNYTALFRRGIGHLAGIHMLRTPSPASDAIFIVDGMDTTPVFHSTGVAGLFNQGPDVLNANWPMSAGIKDYNGMNGFIRSFLPAPISFSSGIYASFEHGHANMLRKDISTTVFWYQEAPHESFPWMLPIGGFKHRKKPLEQSEYVFHQGKGLPDSPIEAETLWLAANGGVYEPQEMLAYGPDWSQNQQLRFDAFQVGASFSFEIPPTPFSGFYRLQCTFTQGPDAPTVAIRINGELITDQLDLFNETLQARQFQFETPIFIHASNRPRITIEVIGKIPKSDGLSVGIDCLRLISTNHSAKQLQVEGPYRFVTDAQKPFYPREEKTEDDKIMFIGLMDSKNTRKQSKTIEANTNGCFKLGDLLGDSMDEGLCFVTWKVRAQHAGIYGFEVEPAYSVPMLIQRQSDRLETIHKSMLWNGIIIHGVDELRYDPTTNQILPYRFRIPLDRGESTLSWLVRCTKETCIIPRIFGL